jgi:lipoprotein-anchoring transpeptidase ErfK/SrfK
MSFWGLTLSVVVGWGIALPALATQSADQKTEQREMTIAQVQPPSLHDAMIALRQSGDRWIEINTTTQRLFAWEGDTLVHAVIVSTGAPGYATPSGRFAIQSMHPTARMRGADYDVPDVPFVMYYDGNYGIHGAYWHHRFGTPVSHGCTNVAVDHAEWLFNWADIGVPVVVHD